jgi:hypothetical protein
LLDSLLQEIIMADPSAPPSSNPYADLSKSVNNAMDELSADTALYIPDQRATELFRLEDQVQIFFVTVDGHVSTFSAPETLRIFQFQESADESSRVFLQVGGWTHPLVPGASPCLQAENGAIMFPDIYSELPNSAVGLVLMDNVASESRTELIAVLQQYTAFKAELRVGDYQLGALGSSLVQGAEMLSKGIGYGTTKAGQLIEYVSEKSQERLAKGEEDAKVGSMAKLTVTAAKSTTNATVKVSGFVSNRVGKLTKSLADYLASKVVEKPSAGGGTAAKVPKQGTMSYLVDAARGGLIAYGTVYENLESNAKVLGTQLKDNTVKVMQHKYGSEASDVLGEAMTAAGNGALTYMNLQSLGAKGLLKSTAKQTGKNVVKNALNVPAKN